MNKPVVIYFLLLSVLVIYFQDSEESIMIYNWFLTILLMVNIFTDVGEKLK